jgi:hypothetical protein
MELFNDCRGAIRVSYFRQCGFFATLRGLRTLASGAEL